MAEARLPKVHIPMAVDTRGIDTGLSAAERKIRASAGRIAAMEARQASASRLALGRRTLGMALQRSGIGGGIGEMAGMALGGGAVGLAAAGLAAGFMAFDVASRGLKDAVTGAAAALKQFEETGKQTFAANETILRGLAKMEEQTKGPGLLTGIFQGFQYGRSAVEGEGGGLSSFMNMLESALGSTASIFGTLYQGGSLDEARRTATEGYLPQLLKFFGMDDTQSQIALALSRLADRRADEQAAIDAKRENI